MQLLTIGTTEIIVILIIVLLLFGGRKIPELMHGVGKGVKSFREGMNGLEVTNKEEVNKPASTDNKPVDDDTTNAQ